MNGHRLALARRLSGSGMEAGAGPFPLDLPEGVHCVYADRTADRLQHLRSRGPCLITDAQDLAALRDESLDFFIANHVVEHLPDPIAGLLSWHRVLRPGGRLFLAVPDARLTFDSSRARTPLVHLLDDHARNERNVADEHLREFARVFHGTRTDEEVAALVASYRTGQLPTTQVHCHVWELEGFIELLRAVERLWGIAWTTVATFRAEETPGAANEFVLVLEKPPVRGGAAHAG